MEKIGLRLVSATNGFHDFDVTGAGSIRRVTVRDDVKRGDVFNVYYGESSKGGAKWLGSKGVKGYLVGDLEKSIKASGVYAVATNANVDVSV